MIPILDNGHGGMIGGQYQTPGKRSPNWPKGILYEGMFNRWFINRLIEKLDRAGIPYFHVSPEMDDIPLWQRVDRANKIHGKHPNTYFLSIHANAGGGEGIEGFTSPGQTKSDEIAEVFLTNLEKKMPDHKFRFDRSDGDVDKESKFFVLTRTSCPAFLFESGFMDHPADYDRLWSEEYLEKMVDSFFFTIKQLYNG